MSEVKHILMTPQVACVYADLIEEALAELQKHNEDGEHWHSHRLEWMLHQAAHNLRNLEILE